MVDEAPRISTLPRDLTPTLDGVPCRLGRSHPAVLAGVRRGHRRHLPVRRPARHPTRWRSTATPTQPCGSASSTRSPPTATGASSSWRRGLAPCSTSRSECAGARAGRRASYRVTGGTGSRSTASGRCTPTSWSCPRTRSWAPVGAAPAGPVAAGDGAAIDQLPVPAGRVTIIGNIPQSATSGPQCLSLYPNDVQRCSDPTRPYFVVATTRAPRGGTTVPLPRHDPVVLLDDVHRRRRPLPALLGPYHVTAAYSMVLGQVLAYGIDLPAFATPATGAAPHHLVHRASGVTSVYDPGDPPATGDPMRHAPPSTRTT